MVRQGPSARELDKGPTDTHRPADKTETPQRHHRDTAEAQKQSAETAQRQHLQLQEDGRTDGQTDGTDGQTD
eukprot:5008980-Alexandrium_andersonii.AAC.1